MWVAIMQRVYRSISSCWVGRVGQVSSLNIMAGGHYMFKRVLVWHSWCHNAGVLVGSLKGYYLL